MIQQALQPIFHLFNTIMPSASMFMVLSAVLSSLPNGSSNREKRHLQQAPMRRTKISMPAYRGTMNYTIPTSMRTRATRNY
jgi:hypothetical protein